MAVGSWYHCYNRGVDKRAIFDSDKDYGRFMLQLFISNGNKNIKVSDLPDEDFETLVSLYDQKRGEPLVEIGAYALMPNHVHFLVREIVTHGTALFMQKVFTGYTMYFNNKNKRTGALFAGSFKSKHIEDDRYLKQVLPYILLNPIELFEPRWKSGHHVTPSSFLRVSKYPYSSMADFTQDGATSPITTTDWTEYYDSVPTFAQMLTDAQAYYNEHQPQV